MSAGHPAAEPSPVELARHALAGHEAWLVGGATRDRLLGRPSSDVDVVLEGDVGAGCTGARPRGSPQRLLRAVLGPSLLAGGQHRARMAGRLRAAAGADARAGPAAARLHRQRDRPAARRGEPIDPLGGIEDLREGRLRAASAGAFLEDPLRVMRLARVAVELDLEAEPETLALAQAGAPGLREVSAERVFAELRRILSAARLAVAWSCSPMSARTRWCCPSSSGCGGWSRAATTTPTCTSTRWRCSSGRWPWPASTRRWRERAARRGRRRRAGGGRSGADGATAAPAPGSGAGRAARR